MRYFYFTILAVLLLAPLRHTAQERDFNELIQQVDTYLAQNPDSAKLVIDARLDRQKPPLTAVQSGQLHNRMGRYFMYVQQYDSAHKAFSRALYYARKAGDQKREYKQISFLANVYNQKSQYDTAIHYYNMAIEFFESKGDSVALASNLSNQAAALIYMGKQKEALKQLFKAEEIYKKQGNHLTLGTTYENIAAIHAELGYEKLVIQYTRKAIRIYKALKNKPYLASAFADIGVAFKQIAQYDSAKYYFNASVELAKHLNDNYLLAKNYLNAGNLYDELGQRSKTIRNYEKSLAICKAENIVYGTYLNYLNLGQLYLDDSIPGKSMEYLEKALELSLQIHAPANKPELYDKLYQAAKLSGNPEKALFYLEHFYAAQDSIWQAQKHEELMELQTKYETAENEAKILRLEKARAWDEAMRYYFIAGFILIVLAVIFFWNWTRQQRKISLQKQRLAEEKVEKMQMKLEARKQEAISYSLQNASFNEFISKALIKLQALSKHVKSSWQDEFDELHRLLSSRYKQGMDWEEFDKRFEDLNHDFLQELTTNYPDLTRGEIRICTLLFLNMNTKEIAQVMNKSTRTIENYRYRIRKKMEIAQEKDITNHIMALTG